MILIGKHIFVVEDNTLNRVIYQISLGKHGASIEFDQWGTDTLQKLKLQKHIDLIILDLMLPQGKSGFEIFKAIRAVPNYDDIPIVAISASEPAIAIPRARKLGFSGFIAKPIDAPVFAQQIAQIINGEEVWYTG